MKPAPLALIVTDTSPLITLALGDALGALLLPGLPVEIPDAVYTEATRVRGVPGAMRIVDWLNENPRMARVVQTEIGIDQQLRLEDRRPIRGMGELAAYEVLDRFLAAEPVGRALLLYEDADVANRRGSSQGRIALLSTGDFLRELQAAGRLQSADRVLEAAAEQGRNVDRLRRMRSAEAAALLRGHLAGDDDA